MLTFTLKNLVLSPFPITNSCNSNKQQHLNLKKNVIHASSSEKEKEEYKVVSAIKTEHNDILILDTPLSRLLLLDSTHTVHSILNKDQPQWTSSYWDEFTSLPAIIPKGPIAILGLGGGTAAHLMLDLWPSLQLEGWEIDPILIDKARQHFGLSDLEKQNSAGGILHIHIRDALSSSGNDSGRYAGIIVDLFCEGKILPQLEEVATWLKLKDRLMEGGRFMVNCGGVYEIPSYGIPRPKSVGDNWAKNSTLKALSEAFPGQVSWKRLPETQGANYLALTGPFPDLTLWSSNVPPHPFPVSENVRKWKPCDTIP
ncbi:S-adenosyl-L-methionine-dependent methyltransferases superfamily protein [Euphorbia peplus]|nr:S-adenosyl-L-methionine-dependent methyltransferases superfamily protein [Euphorbia peplus]